MNDDSMTGTFQFSLPEDLLSAAQRQPPPAAQPLQVEGWRRSWLTRLSEIVIGTE